MILTRTPYRISFVGGGTDCPAFYERYGEGTVVSATINKYVYVSVKEHFEPTYRLSYSKVEDSPTIEEIKHDIVRTALSIPNFSPKNYVEISTMADLPSKAGLGGSSSFTVGLLNALARYSGLIDPNAENLAHTACNLEINYLKRPMGKQDSYAAAHGGINQFDFIQRGPDKLSYVKTTPIQLDPFHMGWLDAYSLLLFTGVTRNADTILGEQKTNTENDRRVQLHMVKLAELAKVLGNRFQGAHPLDDFGNILQEAWRMKKHMARSITNDGIDDLYNKALKAGAKGGKLLGAGGGGFLYLFAEPEAHKKIIEATGLREVPFNFSLRGTEALNWRN